MATARKRTKVNWQLWLIRGASAVIGADVAWVSYWHMVKVATLAGEDRLSAHLLPLVPDALMAIALVKIASACGRVARVVWITLVTGLGLSFAANGLSAWERHSWLAVGVAMVPPAALALTVEMLRHSGRKPVRRSTRARRSAVKAPVKAPERAVEARSARVGQVATATG